MAKPSFLLLVVFLLFLLVCVDIFREQGIVAVKGFDCGGKCAHRCSKASRRKICIRACNTCCRRCDCVPPGTSGNTAVCPCYAHMKTHGGRLKCP